MAKTLKGVSMGVWPTTASVNPVFAVKHPRIRLSKLDRLRSLYYGLIGFFVIIWRERISFSGASNNEMKTGVDLIWSIVYVISFLGCSAAVLFGGCYCMGTQGLLPLVGFPMCLIGILGIVFGVIFALCPYCVSWKSWPFETFSLHCAFIAFISVYSGHPFGPLFLVDTSHSPFEFSNNEFIASGYYGGGRILIAIGLVRLLWPTFVTLVVCGAWLVLVWLGWITLGCTYSRAVSLSKQITVSIGKRG